MTTVLQYLVIAAVIALLLFGLALLVFGRGEGLAALPARTSPAQLPERGIEGADVRRVRFALALRGYRMSDVDWTLDRLADELDRTRRELAEVSATAATGTADPTGHAGQIDGARNGAQQLEADQGHVDQGRIDQGHARGVDVLSDTTADAAGLPGSAFGSATPIGAFTSGRPAGPGADLDGAPDVGAPRQPRAFLSSAPSTSPGAAVVDDRFDAGGPAGDDGSKYPAPTQPVRAQPPPGAHV